MGRSVPDDVGKVRARHEKRAKTWFSLSLQQSVTVNCSFSIEPGVGSGEVVRCYGHELPNTNPCHPRLDSRVGCCEVGLYKSPRSPLMYAAKCLSTITAACLLHV